MYVGKWINKCVDAYKISILDVTVVSNQQKD